MLRQAEAHATRATACIMSGRKRQCWPRSSRDINHYFRFDRHAIKGGHAQAQHIIAKWQAIGAPNAEDTIGDWAIAARDRLPTARIATAAPFERVGTTRAPTH